MCIHIWPLGFPSLVPLFLQSLHYMLLIHYLVFYPKFSSLLCIFSLEYLICAQGFNHQMLTHAQINFPNPNSLLRHELVYTTAWCTPRFDCFTATNLNMDKSHIHAPPPRPAPFLMLLCEFHHPPPSVSTSSENTSFSFKLTLSNNHVQSILPLETCLETFLPPNPLSPLDPNNHSLSVASCSRSFPFEIHSLLLTLTSQ